MNQAEIAQRLARQYHAGQTDKAGEAYVTHPERVARRVADHGGSDEAIAAGWLHDVLEDCPVERADLEQAGVSGVVLEAVVALTKRPGLTMEDYFAGIRGNRVAHMVKSADLDDNTDPARVGLLDEQTQGRLRVKYERSRELLAAAE